MRLLRTSLTVDHSPNALHAIADETLSRLASAFGRNDFVAVAEIIDLEAMGRVMDARSATATKVSRSLSDPDAQVAFASAYFSTPTLRWDSHTIRYVIPIGAGAPVSADVPAGDVSRLRELLAVSTHRHPDGDVRHMRWWLIRGPDSPWRIYDFELSDSVIRMSTELALYVSGALDKATWFNDAKALGQLETHIGWGELEQARRLVDRIDWQALPVTFRARYLIKRAHLEEGEGNPKAALVTLDLAAGVHEDARTMRDLLLHRLSLFASLGRPRDVLATAAQIEALYGKDDVVRGFRTSALVALEESSSPNEPSPTPR